jgi:uncharacterized protein (TIGR01244 family)
MSEFRTVTDNFAVSPQIAVEDVARAKSLGFSLIINNRPDGEAADQPPSEAMAAAARASGVEYVHIPVTGRPTEDQARAVLRASAGATGPTLAFCKSGTRSIIAWALGELAAGTLSRGEILSRAAAAGYDLSAVLPV